MMYKREKKMFSAPKMIKCEQPLDKVTLCGGSYQNGKPRRYRYGLFRRMRG
jgi:hypothetical protein